MLDKLPDKLDSGGVRSRDDQVKLSVRFVNYDTMRLDDIAKERKVNEKYEGSLNNPVTVELREEKLLLVILWL